MNISVKRAYEPAGKTDGARVLADRLWPRGVTKQKAKIDVWAKELAPSNVLRKWFHAAPEARFKTFSSRYRAELVGRQSEARELLKGVRRVTLVTAAKDIAHSHIPTLAKFLKSARP